MIRKLFIDYSDNVSVQFVRYTFVGGTAFIIDFSSLYILTDIVSLHYLLSAAIAFLIGLIMNYVISITWVFSKGILDNKVLEFGIFAFIGIAGLVFNELFMWLFTEHGHLHYLMSKIISTIFVFLSNFFSRKFILFH